jgi:hypothetical protein
MLSLPTHVDGARKQMQVSYRAYWQPEKTKWREFPTLYKGTTPYRVNAGIPIKYYVGVSLYYDIQMCPVVEAVITEQFEFD